METKTFMQYAKAIEHPRQLVSKPTLSLHCWVKIRIPSYNRARLYPEYSQCSKYHRKDKLTCAHHDKWEEEAQKLKWQDDYNKQRVANFKQKFKEQHGREMTPEELKNIGLEGR